MAGRIVSALQHRSPAPLFELASGRVVQTHYLDAVGISLYREWQADKKNAAKFFRVVGLVVPELTVEEIDNELVPIQDLETLIDIGIGQVPILQEAVKNGASGGASPEPPLTPPSNPTTT